MTHPIAPSLPPGPRLPRWTQTLGFIFAPVSFREACHRRYGEIVRFASLFGSPPQFVVIFDPELVKQLFRSSPEQLHGGKANTRIRPLVGERSIFLLDGTEHLRQRKLLFPPFHGERMRAYEAVIRDAADRAIASWPVGQPFMLLPSMQSVALEVIIRVVFGIDAGPRHEEFKRRLRAMLAPASNRLAALVVALTGGQLGTGARKRTEQRRRLVDEIIEEEIARRRNVPDLEQYQDVLSILLLARDDEGEAMTDRELRDELVSLLFAGHETTATALAWALELLLRDPPVVGRLRAELAAGEDAYLNAVVKETLRLRPIISGVGRVVREQPFELGGYLIPPGTEIHFSIDGLHRRADRYPDPHAFRPERFLRPDAPDTYTWVPFGGGTRRCLGASFAMFEMATVIRRVIERASLSPAGQKPEKGVRRGIVFSPERGVRVVQERAPRPPAVPDPRSAAAKDATP